MHTIQISINEYNTMLEEINLLKNTEQLKQMNRLIDILFQEKYGLYMQDFTEDLTEESINKCWLKENTNAWDNV